MHTVFMIAFFVIFMPKTLLSAQRLQYFVSLSFFSKQTKIKVDHFCDITKPLAHSVAFRHDIIK